MSLKLRADGALAAIYAMSLFLRQDVAETPCKRRYIGGLSKNPRGGNVLRQGGGKCPASWQEKSVSVAKLTDLCSKPLLRHSLMSSVHFAMCA